MNISEGQFVSGSWNMKGYAVYEGTFEYQKPIGKGTFKFNGGLVQKGEYVADAVEAPVAAEGENEEEVEPVANDDSLKAQRNVEWKADTVVRF